MLLLYLAAKNNQEPNLQNNFGFLQKTIAFSRKAPQSTAYKNPRPPKEDGDFKKLSR